MRKKILLFASVSVFTGQVFSGTMGEYTDASSPWAPVITVIISQDFVNPGREQTLTLLPPFQNHYTKGSASQTVVDAGGGVGVERILTETLRLQLGLDGYWDSSIRVKGDVWQFALANFDDLSYNYSIHHARVMANAKLLTTMVKYPLFHPYVSGEIGAAFNQAINYYETPLEPGAIATAPFSNHSKTSFAWAVGVGGDYNLNQHLRLGLGYQFADFGSASLGQTTAALTTQSLRLSHIYASQLRFQLTILV